MSEKEKTSNLVKGPAECVCVATKFVSSPFVLHQC